ncbi:hypothetical protein [Saccharopolyspora shandongensis]|uniref:hypothetical protein n=1 Tax=Saccharopolyspora shandongensis TaxID=418495 RepID=UPI003402717E
MHSTTWGRNRRFAVLPFAALALTALVTAGCGQAPGGTTAAAPQPAAGTEQNGSQATESTDETTGSTEQTQKKRFPNTTFYAQVGHYDRDSGMLTFKVATYEDLGPDAMKDRKVLGPDPADPKTHQLNLSPDAKVTAVYGLCSDAPAMENQTCTGTVMGAVRRFNSETVYAEFKVDGGDNIVEVKEIWQE